MAESVASGPGEANAQAPDRPPLRIEPDERGRFGSYGGRYAPEVLMPALLELEDAWRSAREDHDYRAELDHHLRHYAGRPTPLYHARRLSERLGPRVWIKREDLAHTGSHKINNVLGQCLLARRLGKNRVIAETGAGQHGVATATAAALFGLDCEVYMGAEDVGRQSLNVFRMQMLGARVVPVESSSRTLKDAINEAFRDWVANVETTHYVIGSVVGPHPYPWMVAELQQVIGDEAREQILDYAGRLPDLVVACVGGGSNAIGIFSGFLGLGPRLVGVEAGGLGVHTGSHGAAVSGGTDGVLHGAMTRIMQDPDGLILPAHSISAGLDYPGIGPEHAHLAAQGLAEYVPADDAEALSGFKALAEMEGIIPALEPAHAVGWLMREADAGRLSGLAEVVLLLSGRGDKDVEAVRGYSSTESSGW
ncbi:MAG TPA: tryptophan synthase subunit beta [Actinomycetota bacterium]|nr:tryptophan synthase subunit beta [Actinomycetota bacterium]